MKKNNEVTEVKTRKENGMWVEEKEMYEERVVN